MKTINATQAVASTISNKKLREFARQLELQSMVWPGIVFLFIFSYIPMYGIIIAFKEYDLISGFFAGRWVGFQYFQEFLIDEKFIQVLRNTLGMNFLELVVGFPLTIVFALLLNELTNLKFKKFVQTVSYLPHFISWIIFGGIVINLLMTEGLVNVLLLKIGLIDHPIYFLGNPNYFWIVSSFAGILKSFGFGAIIYIATIVSIDPGLYEAATIDGAGRLQKMWHVTLPGIMGTVVIMLIFAISSMVNLGFEQIYILQNSLNVDMSETIETYVYKMGLVNMRFSYSTAVGVFKSVVSMILLLVANYTAQKITKHSLF